MQQRPAASTADSQDRPRTVILLGHRCSNCGVNAGDQCTDLFPRLLQDIERKLPTRKLAVQAEIGEGADRA